MALTKRKKLKMLREMFTANVRTPLRLYPEEWAELLSLVFDEPVIVEEMAALMAQAGFKERRRIKNTFYASPSEALIEHAQQRPGIWMYLGM